MVSDKRIFCLHVIDGLSEVLKKCDREGGLLVVNMLNADDRCIISLSSSGLHNPLNHCDMYCNALMILFLMLLNQCESGHIPV